MGDDVTLGKEIINGWDTVRDTTACRRYSGRLRWWRSAVQEVNPGKIDGVKS